MLVHPEDASRGTSRAIEEEEDGTVSQNPSPPYTSLSSPPDLTVLSSTPVVAPSAPGMKPSSRTSEARQRNVESDDAGYDDVEQPLTVSNLVRHRRPFGRSRVFWGSTGTGKDEQRLPQKWPKTCVLGPDWPCLFVSFMLIWLPTVGVLITFYHVAELWALGLMLASLFAVTFTLCGAAFSDPGIIPKRQFSHVHDLGEDEDDRVRRSEAHNLPAREPGTNHTLCAECLVYRPPGAFHCRDCGVCVREMDHHCPWTSHCIGENNMLFFQFYIGFLVAHITVFIALTMFFAAAAGGAASGGGKF